VLTGNGNASKVQLEGAVRRHLNHRGTIRPYHASDALGLAIIGLFRCGAAGRSKTGPAGGRGIRAMPAARRAGRPSRGPATGR